MFYEICLMGLVLLVAGSVVAMFFCSVELAPKVARKSAELSRFEGLEDGKKMVRFW